MDKDLDLCCNLAVGSGEGKVKEVTEEGEDG